MEGDNMEHVQGEHNEEVAEGEKIGYQGRDGSMHFFGSPKELAAFREEENSRDNH